MELCIFLEFPTIVVCSFFIVFAGAIIIFQKRGDIKKFSRKFFDLTTKAFEFQNREKSLLIYINSQTAQYDSLHEKFTEKCAAMHDFSMHINTINMLLQKSHHTDALSYVGKLAEKTIPIKDYIHTGNCIVDTVFNSKISKAKNLGIEVVIKNVFVPTTLKVEQPDLIVIFANAWENAIEACERIGTKEKYITVGLVHRHKKLIFKLTNSTNGQVFKDGNGKFITSKPNTRKYGIGTQNIVRTVEKYGGISELKHDDVSNVFKLSIILDDV